MCEFQLATTSQFSSSVMWTLKFAWTQLTQRSNLLSSFLFDLDMDEVTWISSAQYHIWLLLLSFFEKRHCRCKDSPKIAQGIFTNLKKIVKINESHEFPNYARRWKRLTICLLVSRQCTNVTDGRTDGQTPHDGIGACNAVLQELTAAAGQELHHCSPSFNTLCLFPKFQLVRPFELEFTSCLP